MSDISELVYIPNHIALQAAAKGLAKAAKLPGPNAHWYLPPKLAALLGAFNIRPDEPDEETDIPASDHLIADWPEHWFADWQYLHTGKLGLEIGDEDR